MSTALSRTRVSTLIVFAGMACACSENPTQSLDAAGLADASNVSAEADQAVSALTAEQRTWIREVRAATRQFKRSGAALAAGYVPLSECVEAPVGGMGYHYGQPERIDGIVEPLAPEILLFEPRPNGSLRLVGVEYVVPLAVSAEAPSLHGQSFHPNEVQGLWTLHVWTERHNPTGMFEDFNPMVSCQHAEDVPEE